MKKCELRLELYEAPKMDVLSMEVEHGFSASTGAVGDMDWAEGGDDDGIGVGYEQEEI